jgi:hypothetical protein
LYDWNKRLLSVEVELGAWKNSTGTLPTTFTHVDRLGFSQICTSLACKILAYVSTIMHVQEKVNASSA